MRLVLCWLSSISFKAFLHCQFVGSMCTCPSVCDLMSWCDTQCTSSVVRCQGDGTAVALQSMLGPLRTAEQQTA